jgi:hypothetical protein
MKYTRILLISIFLSLISACATTSNSNKKYGEAGIYKITAQQADKIAYRAMLSGFSAEKIQKITLPSNGYTATMSFLLDSQDITLMVVEHDEGYSFNMKSKGTMLVSGNIKADQIFKKAMKLAKEKVSIDPHD